MKTHTLSNGIIINDDRAIQCGISVEQNKGVYVKLIHHENKFMLSTIGTWIDAEQGDIYQKELKEMIEILNESNKIL